jgi:hypothetical protein
VRVVAHDRAYDAHQLRLAGADWAEVATRVGYADGRVASLAVTAYLQKIAVELAPDHRRDALQRELDRLDMLQFAYWQAALSGDDKAANIVLKVIDRRCTLFGLDRPDDVLAVAPRTIVISGNTEEYVAGLKAMVEHRDRSADDRH